jgi:hypothetical protein
MIVEFASISYARGMAELPQQICLPVHLYDVSRGGIMLDMKCEEKPVIQWNRDVKQRT